MKRSLTLLSLLACILVSPASDAAEVELKTGQSGIFCKYDKGDGTGALVQLNSALVSGKISMFMTAPGDYLTISATSPFSASAPTQNSNGSSFCVTITKN